MHVLAVVLLGQSFGLLLAVALLPLLAEEQLSGGEMLVAALGGAAGALGLSAFYAAMAMGTISVVAPISALSVVIPVTVGLARGEEPGLIQLAGIAVATVAVMGVSYEPDPEHRAVALRSIALSLLAALGFGTFFVAVDATAAEDPAWTIACVRVGGVATIAAAVVALRPPVRPARSALPVLAAIGTFDIIANALYASATTEGLLSVVAVVGSLYPAVTIVLAYIVLGERLRPLQKAGVVFALLGVAMIAAGT